MSEPYRPPNGTEGEAFYNAWCAYCIHDKAHRQDTRNPGCDILDRTMFLHIGDPAYPPEWVEDENGPRCTAFTRDEDAGTPRCRHTPDMLATGGDQ